MNGQYIVLRDQISGDPVIWDRITQTGRRLPHGMADLSWLPLSQQLIGTGKLSADQSGDMSRLMTFAPNFKGTVPAYDFRAFDPANVGSATDVHYASPIFSPNGGALAFFVINAHAGTTTLWLASYRAAATSVYQWSVPSGSRAGAQPIAAWVNDETLIFAEPGNWRDGLPQNVTLHRLMLDASGDARIGTLATLHTHGSEHGIELRDLSVSQVSGRIAYRLRHFTQASATTGVLDGVDLITLAHPADPIELSRQGTGDGLAWSPDGSVLAATFPGELRFYSSLGALLGTVTGQPDPSYPLWLSPSEVWFQTSTDGTGQLTSVTVK